MKELAERIEALKKEKDAVILAHYYVDGAVQEIADYVGDSYYLSKVATQSKNKTIILCGVKFMGESAKILNPDKLVILPDATADCPMAHMVTPTEILAKRQEFPDLSVVCYINSTAEIKAVSDVCVTSSNALEIVKALPTKNIFFVPDRNLGGYIASLLPEKHFIFNNGFCYVHDEITKESIEEVLSRYPLAKVLVHPECRDSVTAVADYVGSTSGIIDFATKSGASDFIIATEEGILHALMQKNPNKRFHFPDKRPVCLDMKKITLEKIEHALMTLENQVQLEEDLAAKAEKALRKMHEIAG